MFFTLIPDSSTYSFHNFFKKLWVPTIPDVFHGLYCSKGPKNISNNLKLSAP